MNNERSNNRNNNYRGNRNGDRKPYNKQFRPKNTVKCGISVAPTSGENFDAILETLAKVPFDKISFPVYMEQGLLDGEYSDAPYTRTTHVGFIRSYNEETQTFIIAIRKGVLEKVMAINPSVARIEFSSRGDVFSNITKIVLDVEKKDVSEDAVTVTSEQ